MLTLKEKIAAVLRENAGEEFLSADIANRIMERYPNEYRNKGIDQLKSEVGAQFSRIKDPHIKIVQNSSPTRRYWDENENGIVRIDDEQPIQNRSPRRKNRQLEHDLYEPLTQYLKEKQGMYAVRINESKSSNKGKGRNKWRHPDVVGVKGLISNKNLHPSIIAIAKLTVDKAKLYAFEVKGTVTGSSLRDDFHQTVSGSIWANYGFLCTENFDADEETKNELEQLNEAYGIGLIIINKKKPVESYIHTKAREKKLKLDICSTLARNNTDFENFIGHAVGVFENGIVGLIR